MAANRTAEFARTGNFPDNPAAAAAAALDFTKLAAPTPSPPPLGISQSAAGSEAVAVKLEAHGAERAILSHESSHNSTESAQDVLVSPTVRADEANAGRAALYPCYGRQQEADTPVQVRGNTIAHARGQDRVLCRSFVSSVQRAEVDLVLSVLWPPSCHSPAGGQCTLSSASTHEVLTLQRDMGIICVCMSACVCVRVCVLQVGSGDLTSTDVDDNMILGLDGSSNMLMMNNITNVPVPAGLSAAKQAPPPAQTLAHTIPTTINPPGNNTNTTYNAANASVANAATPGSATTGPVDLRAVAARASLWVPSMGRYLGVLSCIEDARGVLPPAVLSSLESLGRDVDKAAAEAAAADAALAAVHQVRPFIAV